MKNRWWIIFMLMGYAALGHFNRVSISVAGAEIFIPVVGISETRMGWVYTAFLIVYTAAMLPGGWLIDRIGASRSLSLLGLVMGAFVVLTGVWGWIADTPYVLWVGLLVIRSIAGLGNAPLHPGAAHVVSDVVDKRNQGTANGVITAGALLGIACCYPIFGWLMDTLTWQVAFVVGGGTLMTYAAVWQLFVVRKANVERATQPGDQGHAEVVSASDKWSVLSNRNIWLVTLSYAMYSYFQYLVFYWMNYYFSEELKVSDVESRWASFWILIAMGAGMAIGGRSTDFASNLFGTTWGRRLIALIGMGFGAVFGYVAVSVSGFVTVASFLAISMLATGMVEGVFWSTATDIGRKARGFSGAFMNTGGNVGGLISPVLTPIIAQQLGWKMSIVLACAISGCGSLLWFLITMPEDEGEESSDRSQISA